MGLKDKTPLGVALLIARPEPVDMAAVRRVAQRAEALGCDLWVTENTLDHVFCFDPVVVLTYAAAVTHHHPPRCLSCRDGGAQPANDRASMGLPRLCEQRPRDPPASGLRSRAPLSPVRGTRGRQG